MLNNSGGNITTNHNTAAIPVNSLIAANKEVSDSSKIRPLLLPQAQLIQEIGQDEPLINNQSTD